MSIGVSMRVAGADEVVARLGRVPATAESAGSSALAKAGVLAGNLLRSMLNQPKHVDPFWGVMGAAGPLGLARRTGLTSAAIIAPGRVYVGLAGEIYTFVAHASDYVKQLEEGGTVVGTRWIPTAAAQTPSGAEIKDIKGSFLWPTERMKNFRNGPPKHTWLVKSAPKAAGARNRSQRGSGRKGRGIGPLAPTPGGLIFLKMKVDSVTTRGHHSFGTVRTQMLPAMEALGNEAAAQIVGAA